MSIGITGLYSSTFNFPMPSGFKLVIAKDIRRAIFLDRDGTISPDEFGYIKDPVAYHLYEESLLALKIMQELGYLIFVVTNQSGIARGYLFAAGLGAGTCTLCEECVGVASRLTCRHPFKARPPMEALGIDVLATAKNARMQVNFTPNGIRNWVGLVLVD